MKIRKLNVSVMVGITTVLGVMHVITLAEESDSVKIVEIFKEIQDDGYEPICPNGLINASKTKKVQKLLISKNNKKVEYIMSLKNLDELDQVRVAYYTGNDREPIRIIDQDERFVRQQTLEPGCTIAILSGLKKEEAA